jgi:hypothetical protein
VTAAERLLDSLRDLLYAWTHRFTRRAASRGARARRSAHVPQIDMHALVERHETRRARSASDERVHVRERVTMHDHAVSRIFDRGHSESEWRE